MKPRRFEVAKLSLNGNPNIGVYIYSSEDYALVPPGTEEKAKGLITEVLGVERLGEVTLFSTRLLGVLLAGNRNGLLLPRTATEEEQRKIREIVGDVNVAVLDTRENALGNLLASNSRAAVVYPQMDQEALRVVRDTLGVEVVKMTVCGSGVVGSVLVVTDKGGLVCPEASDEEVRSLQEIFGVPLMQGTVNFGVSLIRVGLIANSKGALVGEETTGPEIARIQTALGGGA
ncbi:MAG: translation initiation factor IF-6 [Acidilobaceae archaeon]